MGIWTLKKKSPKIDEHDQPTEPVPPDVFPGPTFPIGASTPPNYDTIPAPHAIRHTFYPLPPYPAANAAPVWSGQQRRTPAHMGWARRINTFPLRLLPLEVGLCFVCIQLLLLVRFVCKVWNLAPDGGWVEAVYKSSDILLLPFQILLPPLHQGLLMRIEPYTLLAIVLYGFCSRILVHVLKVITYAHINIDQRVSQDKG